MGKKVLLVGESWTATTMEVKGFNNFFSSKYETGLGWIDKAIEKAGYEFVYMPNHEAAEGFPFTMEELKEYACVILSDVGADTFLVPPVTFGQSKRMPNRCQLMKDYVLQGGSLLMVGGYMTFSGIGGMGKWAHNPVQDVLPVTLFPWDDRMEHCEGVFPETVDADHPILKEIGSEWPPVLGYNASTLKPEAKLLASVCGDPFIAVMEAGKGRTAVFATDCAPHWAPPEFCNWEKYDVLFGSMVDWLTKKS